MSKLKGKIDFELLVSVDHANPNGDMNTLNRPRVDNDNYGMITDTCIKRKIRNRLQDMGYPILIKADSRVDDKMYSIESRLEANPKIKAVREKKKQLSAADMQELLAETACKEWVDVRMFGAVYAKKGANFHLTGPVTLRIAKSVEPIEIEELKITKSTNGSEPGKNGETKDPGEEDINEGDDIFAEKTPGDDKGNKSGMSPDRIGDKFFVRYGVYVIRGSVNMNRAEKTGFSQEDAELLKQALLTLFENDDSSARPAGSMEVKQLYWWQHENVPSIPTSKIHDSVKVRIKPHCDEEKALPPNFKDYLVTYEDPGCVEPEIYDFS